MGMLNCLNNFVFTKFSYITEASHRHRRSLLYVSQLTRRASHTFWTAAQRSLPTSIPRTCLGTRQPPIPPVYTFLALPWHDDFSFVNSPRGDLTTTPQCVGSIINVSQCSCIDLVPYMLRTNVPIWLYWGTPPLFVNNHALAIAPCSQWSSSQ